MVLGVVLAGGEGLRLRPLIRSTPKALVRLAGRPLYAYSLEELSTVTRSLLVVAPPGRGAYFTEASRVVEQETVGSLDSAIRVAWREAEKLSEDLVLLAFTGFLSAPKGISAAVLDFYSSSGYQAVVSVVPVVTGLETYGFVDMKPSGEVKSYVPPGSSEAPAELGYVFAGVMAASSKAMDILAREGFNNGLNKLAAEGVLGAVVWHGDWVEIGYPWDLLEAKRVAMQLIQPVIDPDAKIGREVSIEGRVAIARGARVASSSVIVGPAYIGPRASVEPGAYVHSTVVEAGSTVGAHSVVLDTVALEASTVGPHSYLEASVIGPRALVGAYTLAEAGEPPSPPKRLAGLEKLLKIKTKIGAVVGEAAKIPPRTSLGPGSVVDKH